MKYIPLIFFIASLCIVSSVPVPLAASEMPEFLAEEPLLETDRFPFNLETEEDSSEDDERNIPPGFSSDQNSTSVDVQRKRENNPPQHYLFSYSHSLRKGASITASAAGSGYRVFLDLYSPMAMPYFELGVSSFGAGMYPLAALGRKYPDKPIPILFMGAGSLTFGNMISILTRPAFSIPQPDIPSVRFSQKPVVESGGKKKTVQYAAALRGKQWETAFIAAPEKHQRMQYGFFIGWHQKNIARKDIHLSAEQFTGFIPYIPEAGKSGPGNTGNKTFRRYHTLAGLRMLFIHPVISFEAAGIGSYHAEHIFSGVFRIQGTIFYRYAGFKWRSSYVHPLYTGWNGHISSGSFSASVHPYVIVKPVSLFFFYGFNHDSKKKALSAGTHPHAYGLRLEAHTGIVHYYTQWRYSSAIHDLNAGLRIKSPQAWFSGIRWFDETALAASFQLTDRRINPLIAVRYGVHFNAAFNIIEELSCGFTCSAGQKTAGITDKAALQTYFYYEAPEFQGSVFLLFKKNSLSGTHSGGVIFRGKTAYPYFDFSLSYRLKC